MKFRRFLDLVIVLALAITAYNTDSSWIIEHILLPVDGSWKPTFRIFITKFATPLLAGLLVLIVWKIYNVTLWNWVSRLFYQAGWWVYALHFPMPNAAAGENNKAASSAPIGVVGLFHLSLIGDRPTIGHADSYYVFNDDKIDLRGQWRSDNVWLTDKRIEILFKMEFDPGNGIEGKDNYQGVVLADRQKLKPACGKSCWRGKFYRLDTGLTGAVYAEKLGFFTASQTAAKNAVLKEVSAFMKAAEG